MPPHPNLPGSERKTNVVLPSTSFVGRDADLGVLAERMRRARLLTVLGPPGAGKTRLALELVLRHGAAFLQAGAGGIWLADLTEAMTLDDFFRCVAEALDLSLVGDRSRQDTEGRLAASLAARGPTLLVLDNFEQLVKVAGSPLERWLRRAPELSALVTSRTRLALSGEVCHEIGGLSLPNAGAAVSDAVELFLDRAKQARPDFEIPDAEMATVVELVSRLDGLPLAIELAGARMGVLAPKQLLERLQRSFDLLRGGRGRAATLRATLDWSWELLAPHERDALAQLSVFHGGFELEAAEAVVDLAAHAAAPDLLDVLQSLRDSSLLRTEAIEELAFALRYRLLDTVRAHAEEKLETSGQAAAARDRHARHFVRVATDWASEVERPRGPERLRRLVAELPNLLAVHRWSLVGGSPSTDALSRALQVTLALEHVFYMRGPTAPCLALLDAVFAHDASAVDPKLVALALKARGRALRDLGRPDESLEALRVALELGRALGDESLLGRVLGHVALAHQALGEMEAALSVAREGLAAVERAGDRRTCGMLHALIGGVLAAQGRVEEAAAALDSALELDEAVGNRYAAAAARAQRGEVSRALGRPEAARQDLERALEVYREFGERRHEGLALADLGVLHQEQGRFVEARECLERALAHQREFGSRPFECAALGALGDLARERGDLQEARRVHEQALRLAVELGDRSVRARLVASLAGDQAQLGRVEAAKERFAELEPVLVELEDPSLERTAELEWGQLDLALAQETSSRGDRRRADELEKSARARLERASRGPPLAVRPGHERVAFRVLEHSLDVGAPPPSRELTPPRSQPVSQVGRYQLLIQIASGGMATVYVGRQRGAGGFERVVAIKRMHPHLASSSELAESFMAEARIASLLEHPNVVSVQDVYESGGERLLVMDYVDGTSLMDLMTAASRRGLTLERGIAVHILSQVLRGLHAAHEARDLSGTALGVIHRDATPHNVLLGADGSVRITDFGIAKLGRSDEVTDDGRAKGKLRYMAPEQMLGQPLDRRADVYAVGVVAWELFAGRRLFEQSSDLEIVELAARGGLPGPASAHPDLPAELDRLILRAIDRDRERRFPTALAFAEALGRWALSTGQIVSDSEIARLVEDLCGAELVERRRSLSQALAELRAGSDPFPSIPPPSLHTAAFPEPVGRAGPASATLRDGRPRKLTVGSSGRWLTLPSGKQISLQRRRALRLIVKALVERRLDAPGHALDQQELLAAGWPGEKVKFEAGALRVYNALSTLRKLGLRGLLTSRDDGYLLDPAIEVERVPEVEGS